MHTLLLVGCAGHGKSSLGNKILGVEAFDVDNLKTDISIRIERNSLFEVIDCHGLFGEKKDIDTLFKRAEDVVLKRQYIKTKEQFFSNNYKDDFKQYKDLEQIKRREAFEYVNPGFDVLIFVIKFGIRFTKQEKRAVEQIKLVFGENVFKNWGIIVFTFGENLRPNDDFEKFIRKVKGDLKELIVEVQNRCFLMHNNSYKQSDIDTLVKHTLTKNCGFMRYTFNEFQSNTSLYIKRLKKKCSTLRKDATDILEITKNILQNNKNLVHNSSYTNGKAFSKDLCIKQILKDINLTEQTLDKVKKTCESSDNKPNMVTREKSCLGNLFIRIRQFFNCKRINPVDFPLDTIATGDGIAMS